MDLRSRFKDVFGREPVLSSKAPGRVNLIGEHTDYNDGYVMPVAIQYATTVLGAPREDKEVRLFSVDFESQVVFSIDKPISKNEDRSWSQYEKGVIDEFLKRGDKLSGADLLIQGNVPLGAGLSSSASVEIATAGAVRTLNRISISCLDLVKLCQRAENDFVGMKCGIMDQFISCLGEEGHALFLDCRTLEYEIIPFPSQLYSIVIMNTKVKRELVGSAYNERRGQCEEAVRALQAFLPGIRALRDVAVADFERYQGKLSETVRKRCEHVVRENQRVLDFRKSLKQNEQDSLGRLLVQSHDSLRDLYEVSCPELDAMVDIAMGTPGVVGARMTGAGFGGCAIALVAKGMEGALRENVLSRYQKKTGICPEVYVSSPSHGSSTEFFK
jgi:galactokinase